MTLGSSSGSHFCESSSSVSIYEIPVAIVQARIQYLHRRLVHGMLTVIINIHQLMTYDLLFGSYENRCKSFDLKLAVQLISMTTVVVVALALSGYGECGALMGSLALR